MKVYVVFESPNYDELQFSGVFKHLEPAQLIKQRIVKEKSYPHNVNYSIESYCFILETDLIGVL